MWNKFTISNYSQLKKNKKKYINNNSLLYKKIKLHLDNLKNFNDINFKIKKYEIDKYKLSNFLVRIVF